LSRAIRELRWRPLALADREAIMTFIAADNVAAAIELDTLFEQRAEVARQRPTLYKAGRVRGTRELVVQPNYVMVYRVADDTVEILRVLHTRQEWP
jgi:addiction module RelE/StbE family toxin